MEEDVDILSHSVSVPLLLIIFAFALGVTVVRICCLMYQLDNEVSILFVRGAGLRLFLIVASSTIS